MKSHFRTKTQTMIPWFGIWMIAFYLNSQTSKSFADSYWPGTDSQWQTITAANAGADPTKLANAVAFAATNNSYSLVILWNGYILTENYWGANTRTSSQPIFSATKSLVNSLVGMAIADGKIAGTNEPCADFLPQWSGQTGYDAITIYHLLSMTSGIQGGQSNLDASLRAASEVYFATHLPLAYPPGTFWDYNNPVYQLFFNILPTATGQSLTSYTSNRLLAPLGMTNAYWYYTVHHAGSQYFTNYQHLYLTALDAARFGLFALRGGQWNGVQLVSSNWLQTSIHPSQNLNNGYGLFWWLNSSSNYFIPLHYVLQQGPICPDVPPDAYAALGDQDNKIWIVPSLNLVVARLGLAAYANAPAISQFDDQLMGRICNAFGYVGPTQSFSLSITNDGTNITVSVPTWDGRLYSLQACGALSPAAWTNLPGFDRISGTGLSLLWQEPSTSPVRFFKAQTFNPFTP